MLRPVFVVLFSISQLQIIQIIIHVFLQKMSWNLITWFAQVPKCEGKNPPVHFLHTECTLLFCILLFWIELGRFTFSRRPSFHILIILHLSKKLNINAMYSYKIKSLLYWNTNFFIIIFLCSDVLVICCLTIPGIFHIRQLRYTKQLISKLAWLLSLIIDAFITHWALLYFSHCCEYTFFT